MSACICNLGVRDSRPVNGMNIIVIGLVFNVKPMSVIGFVPGNRRIGCKERSLSVRLGIPSAEALFYIAVAVKIICAGQAYF